MKTPNFKILKTEDAGNGSVFVTFTYFGTEYLRIVSNYIGNMDAILIALI